MLPFRSLDPFRPLREPDRRRRDEERPFRSKQGTGNKPKNHLTEKPPYKSATKTENRLDATERRDGVEPAGKRHVVQLVERPQIAMAGPLGIYSSGAERVIDPLQYGAISE